MQKHDYLKLGRVTWWKGCVGSYSSVYGFGAAFCFLNAVRPADFVELLSSLFDRKHRFYLADIPLGQREQARSLGALLKEDPSFIQSLDIRATVPTVSVDHVSELIGYPAWHRIDHGDLRHCPVCWKEFRYHSTFHTLQNISRCPIHGCALTVITQLMPRALSSQLGRDSAGVETLLQHLRDDRRESFRVLMREKDALGTDVFDKYVKRSRALMKGSTCLHARDYAYLRESWDTNKAQLSLASPSGLPPEVSRIVGASTFKARHQSFRVKISAEEREKVLAAFEVLGFERIMGICWTTQVLTGFEGVAGMIDAQPFNPSLNFEDVDSCTPYYWYLHQSLSDAAATGYKRIAYDDMVGFLMEKGNGLHLGSYESLGSGSSKGGLSSQGQF